MDEAIILEYYKMVLVVLRSSYPALADWRQICLTGSGSGRRNKWTASHRCVARRACVCSISLIRKTRPFPAHDHVMEIFLEPNRPIAEIDGTMAAFQTTQVKRSHQSCSRVARSIPHYQQVQAKSKRFTICPDETVKADIVPFWCSNGAYLF